MVYEWGTMTQHTVGGEPTHSDYITSTAQYMAEQLSKGFKAHDVGKYEEAIDAFYEVDTLQFRHLDDDDAFLAAKAFVDALWAKDEIEFQCLRDGEIQVEDIKDADYSPVRQRLRQRASIIGADPRYAEKKAEAWRRHKCGGDYWTPYGWSQVYELRAALDDPLYPEKPRAGLSGLGPEALRYVLANELHDMHTEESWEEGLEVLVPYYLKILRSHTDNGN